MTYQERWCITARLLGYRVVKVYGCYELHSPDGIWVCDIYGNVPDLTHWSVVADMDKRFGIKWDKQPYLNKKGNIDASIT